LREKVIDEITEELGVGEDVISDIVLCGIFDQEEPNYNKTWIVHAVRVELNTNDITIDWEAEDFAWVRMEEVDEYQLLPGFDQVLKTVFKDHS
jgi:predicted NUDIX family phosphoesterase